MQRTSKDLGVFGLRYLEEEDAMMNDIVGCLAEQPPTNLTYATTQGSTFGGTTGCDENDTDSGTDGGPVLID